MKRSCLLSAFILLVLSILYKRKEIKDAKGE